MDRNPRSGGFPKTVYTSRTKSALSAKAPKSSSAMSTRTYSRIRGSADQSGDTEKGLKKNMSFEDVSPFVGKAATTEEMENERELLQRMIDQQRQLQDLQERQKRILDLQHQLASMDQNSGSVMEEKLSKLKAAKSRLDELQELVGTIKSAETPEKKGAGDNAAKRLDDKNQRIRKALDELNDLKSLINMMSISQYDNKDSSAVVKPVFHNSINQAGESEEDYKPVLPEVSVVQQDDDEEDSEEENQPPYFRKSPLLKALRAKDKSTPIKAAPKFLDPFNGNKKVQKNKEPRKTKRDSDVSERLYSEMRRHEILLKELRERRKELDELMNVTKTESEADVDYNDANDSTRSNIGSPDDSRGLSDAEENGDFETSQSGRLFGLNESDTRRLIDIIRNQKTLGATTEKTTATWGSSSSGSDDEEDIADESAMNDSRSQSMAPPKEVIEAVLQSKDQSAKSSPNRDDIRESLSLLQEAKERYEQRPYRGEYEIDFRPPTRRRKDSAQPKRDAPLFTAAAWKAMIDKLQDDLSSSNATMHLLLEDQQALTRLLQNTLNLQQSSVASNMCYGISPDFLIYQLDNCSAQFAALQKETKSLQWQLYDLTKNPPSVYGKSNTASAGNRAAYVMPFDKLPLDFLAKSKLEDLEYDSDGEPSKAGASAKPTGGKRGAEQMNASRQEGAPFSEKLERAGGDEKDDSTDLFEALRDSIYSEAAILISQNEARPHFLIELFHCLQKLNTDYLRQHCLYVLQDVMKGYLPDSPRKSKGKAKYSPVEKAMKDVKKSSLSENTPSESAATSEDELYAKLKAKASAEGGYDFSLKVSSASELSTPSGEETESNPFAAEDLGSTVIHLDAALRHMREMERIKQEISSSSTGANGDAEEEAAKGTTGEVAQVNTKLLRTRIKHIVSEVIPILKNNRDKMLDAGFLKNLQQNVVQIVARTTQQNGKLEDRDGDAEDKENLTNFFSGQLNSILEDALQKFLGQRVGACGEDLVIGLSEVLFNELAFYTMMQDLGKEKAWPTKTTIPAIKVDQEDDSQQEEEVEPTGEEDADKKQQDKDDDSDSSATNDNDAAEGQEDSLGDAKMDATEKSGEPVTVDLSVSETKPLTSYGSGEDEEDGSGDDFTYKETDVPTSMQHDQDAAVPQEEEGKQADTQPEGPLPAVETKSGSETGSDQD